MPPLPPIRLIDYYVEHLEYSVNHALGQEPDELVPFSNIGFDVNYEIREWPDVASEANEAAGEIMAFRVTVKVDHGPDVPETSCYRASVKFAGLFERQPLSEFEDPPSPEDYLTHCFASVISTLYGAAREVLSSLSAPSPFPKLVLPSIPPFAVAQSMLRERALAAQEGTTETE